MKRSKFKIFIVFMLALCFCVTLVACDFGSDDYNLNAGSNSNNSGNSGTKPVKETFGMFSYRGVYLTSYKTSDITETEAKDMITIGENQTDAVLNSLSASTQNVNDTIPENIVNAYLTQYKSISVVSRFWYEDENGNIYSQDSQPDEIFGTDFKTVLEKNEIQISTGIIVPNVIVYKELFDEFETANENFKLQENYIVSPFKDLYTYHKNDTNFVLRSHYFVEIPASQIGGASCSFIQENESEFYYDGRLTRFQSSLGTKLQTKTGTQCEGTIFEIIITWNEKE